MAVHRSCQNQGIARKLVEHGKTHLTAQGVDVLLVYGDPAFYHRFGFDADLAKKFVPPYPLTYEFGWQAMMLSDKQLVAGPYPLTCVKSLSNPAYW